VNDGAGDDHRHAADGARLGEGGEQNAPLGRAVIGGSWWRRCSRCSSCRSSIVWSVVEAFRGRRSRHEDHQRCGGPRLRLLIVVGIIPRLGTRASSGRSRHPFMGQVEVTVVNGQACVADLRSRASRVDQSLHESPIYARTTGYVERWTTDIGRTRHSGGAAGAESSRRRSISQVGSGQGRSRAVACQSQPGETHGRSVGVAGA